MTFSPGSTITAGDQQLFAGTISSNQAYPDALSCADKIAALWGVGYGDYGYGQGVPVVYSRSAGDNIQSVDWVALRTALVNMATHQATSISGFPAIVDLQPGDTITATGYDWLTAIQAVSAARANFDPALMSQTADITSSRSTPWNTAIEHEIEINFGTEDAARTYFNTGSELRFASDLASPPDAHSTAWQTMLRTMGSINIGAINTTQSGSGGTPVALGYLTLTNSYQTVFTQNVLAPYAGDSIEIQAKVDLVVGANGGNGSKVLVKVIYTETSAGDVSGVITSSTFVYKPDGSAISVSSPAFSTLVELGGGGAPTYFYFNQTISTTVTNYNLLNEATAAGYDGVSLLYATVTVDSTGVLIGYS